jgi:uncharacterized protein (TIGR04222 family)
MWNPISDLSGPSFLLFYGVLIALVYWWTQHMDGDRAKDAEATPAPEIPQAPDAYEVAWLRGGEREVLEVATGALCRRGFLTLESGTLRYAECGQDPNVLTEIEGEILQWFRTDSEDKQTANTTLRGRVNELCAGYREKAWQAGLLRNEEWSMERIAAVLLVGAVGFVRLFVGLARGESVGFLAIMLCVGCGILIDQWQGQAARLNSAGRRYLNRLIECFQERKQAWMWQGGMHGPSTGDASGDWGQFLVVAGIFGLADLGMGDVQKAANATFSDPKRDADGSVFWGSGGDGGGDGGCGGGCGGCGGCG